MKKIYEEKNREIKENLRKKSGPNHKNTLKKAIKGQKIRCKHKNFCFL